MSRHRFPGLLLLAVALAAADPDVIVLDNRKTLRGSLQEDPTSPEHVLIVSESGSLRIRRSRIALVEQGLSARLAGIADTDVDGLIGIARQYRARGRNADALATLDKAMALVRTEPARLTDPAAAPLYLRLVDELRGPEAALPLYRWYRGQGGADPATIQRLQTLEAVAGTGGASSILPVLAAPVPDPAAKGGLLNEGLEMKGWMAEDPQWSNPITSAIIDLGGKDALKGVRRALSITLSEPEKTSKRGKAALKKRLSRDCSETPAVSFRVKNTGEEPLSLALAIKTGDWVFFESQPQQVKAGETWKELRFDLTAKTFKSSATNWSFSTAVDHLDDVKELQLLIYTRDAAGSALISSMNFLGADEL